MDNCQVLDLDNPQYLLLAGCAQRVPHEIMYCATNGGRDAHVNPLLASWRVQASLVILKILQDILRKKKKLLSVTAEVPGSHVSWQHHLNLHPETSLYLYYYYYCYAKPHAFQVPLATISFWLRKECRYDFNWNTFLIWVWIRILINL